MAFTDTKVGSTVFGNKRIHWGTYVNTAGSTGGLLDTVLNNCDWVTLTPRSAAVIASMHTIVDSFPNSGSQITVVTGAEEGGDWVAFGN